MLAKEVAGHAYSKAEHRRSLQPRLENRSEGSIEFKHQNISAVLIRAGHIYVRGYKPAWNYQELLEEVVLSQIAENELIVESERLLIETAIDPIRLNDTGEVFVSPPEKRPASTVQERAPRQARKMNFAEREARNRKLGKIGEEFVLAVERQRLESVGRSDLAKEVEWTSEIKGDGTGYDIRSFSGGSEVPLFIEVKTTNSGKYQPFLLSQNELLFSEDHSEKFALYRVFEFSRRPQIFRLNGYIGSHVNLSATTYRASF